MAIRQEVNTPLILTIGIVSGILLLIVAFGVEGWFRYEQDREIAAKWEQAQNPYDSLRKEQLTRIGEYRIPSATSAAAIPIERAMKIVVETGGKLPSTQPASRP